MSENLIHLTMLTLSNNDIHVDDIGTILNKMFQNLPSLETLTLHSNRLTGDLSQWTYFDSDYSENLTVFTLHQNYIYGKISSQIKLNKSVTSFTVFGNRLSCLLPKHFIDYKTNNNKIKNTTNITNSTYYMVILAIVF